MSRVRKTITRVGTAILCLGISAGCAYFLTPNTKKSLAFNEKQKTFHENSRAQVAPDHFMRFVNRLNEDTGIMDDSINEENNYYGFNINFDNFEVAFKKDENSAENKIGIAGDIDLKIKTIKDIAFNLDIDVDYNGRDLPLELGFVNKTAYFGLKDLRMKVGSTTIDELFGNEEEGIDSLIGQIFMASKEEGGINFDVESYIDDIINDLIDNKLGGMIANMDMSNLSEAFAFHELAEGEKGLGLVVNENEIEGGYKFNLDIQIRNDSLDTTMNLALIVNEAYRLTRVDLGTIDLGNVIIKGALNINAIENYTVYAPDNTDYRKYNPNHNYIEVINYKGWLQKLANFIDEDGQKFGVDFALNLKQKDNATLVNVGTIEGAINADFSKLLDFSDYTGGTPSVDCNATFRNSAALGLDLHIFGQNNEEYSNLMVNYIDGQGYLKLNETENEQGVKKSVVKSKVPTETMNWLIDEMPGMFANMSGDGSSESLLAGLFSFVTDSTFVKGIKDGDYSVVLDILKTLKNTEKTIEIGLDLSSLGFGDDAEVELVLDSEVGENHKVLNLGINNIEMGTFVLNASINTNEFVQWVLDDESEYDSLDFLPTVFDQVANIVDTHKAGFTVEGSMFDKDGIGFSLDGKGQFDYKAAYGFGDLTIDQYKYKNKGVWYSHKIAIDIDNTTDDKNINNAHFVYGEKNGKNIKGKVTVQSVLDIFDVIMTFLDENRDQEKWTKFLDPIEKMLSIGELGAIINQKDYFRLLKNDLVKSAKRNSNQLDLIIGGELFDFENDMTVRVNLKDDKLDSLELIDFCFANDSKKLNVKVALTDFDETRESSVDKSNLSSFMDLSSIALLLKFGIKTTDNNYWHLTANIDLDLGVVELFKFKVEVYVVVQDSYCKIYGVIEDAKISFAVQNYNDFTTSALKSEFTFETYPEGDPNREDGVGGYFHFKVTETKRISGDHVYHYKTTSKNLLQSDNLLKYLLQDFLYVRSYILDLIGNVDLSSSEEKEAGDFTNTFTDTGFKYSANEKKWSVGLNLDVLTGVDALKDLEINIYGNNQEKFSKLSGKLQIEAMKLGSLSTKIGIGFNVTLENTDTSITDWSNSLQSKFTKINSVSFTSAYLNNPDKYLQK